jgi:hypothetical protein
MLSLIAWKPGPTTTQTTTSPFGPASDAVVVAARPPKLMLLPAPGPRRALAHPCDASCKKTPQDASQNSAPQIQPTEKEELKTR